MTVIHMMSLGDIATASKPTKKERRKYPKNPFAEIGIVKQEAAPQTAALLEVKHCKLCHKKPRLHNSEFCEFCAKDGARLRFFTP